MILLSSTHISLYFFNDLWTATIWWFCNVMWCNVMWCDVICEHKFKIFLPLRQRITFLMSQIALAIEFFTVEPNIFGRRHETCFMSPFLKPRILRLLLHFWNICIPLLGCFHNVASNIFAWEIIFLTHDQWVGNNIWIKIFSVRKMINLKKAWYSKSYFMFC
jgi:hypothetical protein